MSASKGKIVPLSILFVILVLFFALIKLPQARVTGVIQGYLQMALDPYGILITDRGRELSILQGFAYKLDHPTLELPDMTRIELDEISARPKWLALLTGKAGVTATLKQGNSDIDVDAIIKGDQIDFTLNLNEVDIGRIGLLSFAGSLKGSGTISGDAHADGKLSDPSSLSGGIDLKLKHLRLDEQNVMGFQLPSLNVSDGTIQVDIQNGKLQMKDVQLGKSGDDLSVKLTGDITLNRYINASPMNLKAVFGLSEKVKKSLPILETILGSAKAPDGKYAYKLTGTLAAPFPVPQ